MVLQMITGGIVGIVLLLGIIYIVLKFTTPKEVEGKSPSCGMCGKHMEIGDAHMHYSPTPKFVCQRCGKIRSMQGFLIFIICIVVILTVLLIS